MSLRGIFEKLIGVDKLKAEAAKSASEALEIAREAAAAAKEAVRVRQEAEAEAELAKKEAQEKIRLSKLTPKEAATERKESYIAVLDTKVNKENVKNGFFELDWNEYFIIELRLAGYQGDTEEEIVDKWFQDVCRNIGSEVGVDMDRRGSGYINVNNLGQGKSEIS
jgi:hypothetical protein